MSEGCVAIVGVGTMGAGIAETCLRAGFGVRMFDTDPARVRSVAAKLQRTIEDALAAGVEAVSQLQEVADGASLVIECVPELRPVKEELLGTLAKLVGDAALIASNTSTMSIRGLASETGLLNRLVGLHFFNPAQQMRLVEVVTTPELPDTTVRAAVRFVERLGKVPVTVSDQPGFVTSRLGLVLGNEAMRLVEDGICSVAGIDTAMRLGYNHPMGPLELADLVGLDARLNNVRALHEALLLPAYEPPALLQRMVERGWLGRKSGRGFYQYERGTNPSPSDLAAVLPPRSDAPLDRYSTTEE